MINKNNKNNERHGYWEKYYADGQLWFKGNYINGNRTGWWEYYDTEKTYKQLYFI